MVSVTAQNEMWLLWNFMSVFLGAIKLDYRYFYYYFYLFGK